MTAEEYRCILSLKSFMMAHAAPSFCGVDFSKWKEEKDGAAGVNIKNYNICSYCQYLFRV